jgi:hypothetical protein
MKRRALQVIVFLLLGGILNFTDARGAVDAGRNRGTIMPSSLVI